MIEYICIKFSNGEKFVSIDFLQIEFFIVFFLLKENGKNNYRSSQILFNDS